MPDQTGGEAARLEQLWSGEFGEQYVERNVEAGGARGPFWDQTVADLGVRSVLEVGCNVGANLGHLARRLDPRDVWGVDVNETSLQQLRGRHPGVNSGWAVARNLPFRDGWFDLVFTVAVLIHVPEDALPIAMAEMVRCSRRHILAIEYLAPETVEVDYRGQKGAFFKRDYGQIFTSLFPELRLRRAGEVTKADGFDDGLGLWLLEKP